MIGQIVPGRRLQTIAEMVGKCDCLADIGCDHGRLCGYMLQKELCRRAVMTDISDFSLEKARNLMQRLGLSDRAAFRVGDGAMALDEPPDVAVIAGMGGALIADILARGRQRLGEARLVLQPNVAVRELRSVLVNCGYVITDEQIVRDSGRLYVILAAKPGVAQYTAKEMVVGPVLLKKNPPLLRDYAAFRLRVARKALAGALAGGDDAAICLQRQEEEIWKEFSQ